MALRAQGVPTISFNFANVGSGETAMCPNTIANLNQTIIHLVDCPDVECGTFVEMLFLDEGKNILDRYFQYGFNSGAEKSGRFISIPSRSATTQKIRYGQIAALLSCANRIKYVQLNVFITYYCSDGGRTCKRVANGSYTTPWSL